MEGQLQTISRIFTEKIYRIPDYQRGYAWREKQLKDFWSDIVQLEMEKNHYVGVLTLEEVPKNIYENWDDDLWIIQSKSYRPYYVVDGQQRLTTAIILLQSITEIVPESTNLNFTKIEEIRKRYIFDSKDGGISRSYFFGYEKDNPSYEYLKTKIFQENSTSSYRKEETIYTYNLEAAKKFFIEKLKLLSIPEIEVTYRKVTQHLLFNIYTISSDIDVFIAFETMNNRGKPLSNLELLKNRLIFLSTKFGVVESERKALRRRINDTWKGVYHFLGKNKDKPLYDDVFLRNHFISYYAKDYNPETHEFGNSNRRMFRSYSESFSNFLLEEKFTLKKIMPGENGEIRLTINDINSYIQNLQSGVELWYYFHNSHQSSDFTDEEKFWIDKIYRIGIKSYGPILISFYQQESSKEMRLKFLKSIERMLFVSTFSFYYFDHEYDQVAHKFLRCEVSPGEFIAHIDSSIKLILQNMENTDNLINQFKTRGFYDWPGIKYFLFEYDLSLKDRSKTYRNKIVWEEYVREQEDFITVEHILPQSIKDKCWKEVLSRFGKKQIVSLTNSLGNLLPLSKPKNSSLQNKCFKVKVDNGENQIGYRFGSLSENEVSRNDNWTPRHIKERGLKLLSFMERRWDLKIGDEDKKIEMLGLTFLKSKDK